ncbi:MAG: hypothetical protein IPO28_10045 [Holophagaceae bacterium]|nr:hypothetical protein [Holophagaceae bacterium]
MPRHYQACTASLKYHKTDSPFEAQFFYTYAINGTTTPTSAISPPSAPGIQGA